MKTVHRVFFNIFFLLENDDWTVGSKVIVQRKLLFLEKLFASLLLGGPRVKEQLCNRIRQLDDFLQAVANSSTSVRKSQHLKVLVALDSLINFYLPAVFRVGYKVRSCTWEGRNANSGVWAKDVMEEVLILLVHLLQDTECKNEYVRTLSVALATWQPWMSKIPAVCFMEESCEAMLSRMGHRCDVYRTLHGFDHTYNLFLTLPPPSRAPKSTRGMLKDGLVQVFTARMRKIVFHDGQFPFSPVVGARDMHSILVSEYPSAFEFPSLMQASASFNDYEHVLQCAIRCLMGKGKVSEKVSAFMDEHMNLVDTEYAIIYERCVANLQLMFRKTRVARTPAVPKPRPRKVFLPKPKGVFKLSYVSLIFNFTHGRV